jgi:hypothetical protein
MKGFCMAVINCNSTNSLASVSFKASNKPDLKVLSDDVDKIIKQLLDKNPEIKYEEILKNVDNYLCDEKKVKRNVKSQITASLPARIEMIKTQTNPVKVPVEVLRSQRIANLEQKAPTTKKQRMEKNAKNVTHTKKRDLVKDYISVKKQKEMKKIENKEYNKLKRSKYKSNKAERNAKYLEGVKERKLKAEIYEQFKKASVDNSKNLFDNYITELNNKAANLEYKSAADSAKFFEEELSKVKTKSNKVAVAITLGAASLLTLLGVLFAKNKKADSTNQES